MVVNFLENKGEFLSLYFLEKESRTKDLLFQSVLSYAKINEVREILKHETFKGNCTVFFTKVEHYHTKETDYVKINRD